MVINEFAAASSDRLLRWQADGTPRMGSGVAWMESGFSDAAWSTGGVPMGWGSSVTTNLQSAMLNKTPTLYLRKAFTVSAAQAAMTQPLTLQVDADDGFVAFINGVEVARANAGGAKHFVYAGQPAYNPVAGTGIVEYAVGTANTLLVPGTNVLAIQVLNNNIGSSLRINAGLKVITSPTRCRSPGLFTITTRPRARREPGSGPALRTRTLRAARRSRADGSRLRAIRRRPGRGQV